MHCSGIDIDFKIHLIAAYFLEEKPDYKTSFEVQHPLTGKTLIFRPGKVLNSIADAVLPSADGRAPSKKLTQEQKENLHAIQWFSPWLEKIRQKRIAGPESNLPDLDEKVELMCREYSGTSRPTEYRKDRSRDVRSVVRDNGLTFDLYAFRILEKIAPNWFGVPTRWNLISDSSKTTMESMPWFEEWINVGKRRREVALLQKQVPKEAKLAELHKHYNQKPNGEAAEKPSWTDVIPMQLPTGKIFNFKIATFLDDLAGNFLEGSKPGVVLDEQQKEDLLQLPWVPSWLSTLKKSRAKRKHPDTL